MTTAIAEPIRFAATRTDPLAFNHHWKQARYELCRSKKNVIPAGRRSGKTKVAKRRGIKMAMANTFWPDFRVIFGGPTQQQSKDIWWDDLKKMLHRRNWEDVKVIRDKSETELLIHLINGSILKVAGLDKPERVEGPPVNHVFVTEAANVKEEAITQHIFPMLIERDAGIDLESAPEGRNYLYRLACYAQEEEHQPEWSYHHWTSAEILPYYLGIEKAAEVIERARDEMDERVFKQEFEADFIHFEGRAYYAFQRGVHAKRSLPYDPEAPLHLCFDFNIEPGVAVVIQEGLEQRADGGDQKREDRTLIIGQVTIPRNSTTPAVCRKLAADWGRHKGQVFLYGDPTGASGGSAKVRGSDWDIIKQELYPVFAVRLHSRVSRGSPRERDRVNAVNSRLESATGKHRMFVDPNRASDVADDFDEVIVLKGGAGEINKNADDSRTHHTDAIGYYMMRRHPLKGGGVYRKAM